MRRSEPERPVPRGRPSMTLSNNVKVTLITVTLVTLAGAFSLHVTTRTAPFAVDIQWWELALAFALSEWAVAHVEIRKQSHTISMSEATLLTALVVAAPLHVIAGRIAGASLALAVRRQKPQKFAFNVALFGAEAAFASFLFHVAFRHPEGEAAWAFAGLSVLTAVMFGTIAVAGVISLFDHDRPAGLLLQVMRAQLTTALGSVSLAVIGAAAVSRAWSNIAYLAVLVVGGFAVLKEQAAVTQRASNLAAVGDFTSRLAGLTGTEEVLAASLVDASKLLRSTRAVMVVHRGARLAPGAYEANGERLERLAEMPERLARLRPLDAATLLSKAAGPQAPSGAPDEGVVAPVRVGDAVYSFVLWDRSTEVGGFSEADLPLFSALAAQTRVAAQRAMMVDRLEHDARHDALTGLPNRAGLTAAFDELAPDEVGTLFVLDLDRFKDVNDTLGHPTGDRALQIIAERLQRLTGDALVLARLGGDEFAVFDPAGGDAAAASDLAGRIIATIEAPIRFDGLSLQIGASIGIAVMPEHGDDLTTLMSHADIAMYVAKAGHSGWQFYSPDDDNNSPRRLDLVAGLRAATENGELDVWYQPKLRLSDGTVSGAEALARWRHPRYGYIPPDEFITLAEGGGLMRELTNAVLQRTMRDALRWAEEGRPLQVAVNLSMRNLLDDSLPNRLAEMLVEHGLSADLISFEVTETAIMSDRDRVAAVLQSLRSLGFRLAIDDYGTGYSSLAYLRELPVDELKIDRTFVTNLDLDNHNEVIVRSTIDLGHNLGLQVVAEGVEREAELTALQRLGCDYVQGYLLSRPLPADRFEAWLTSHGTIVRPPDATVVADVTRSAH